MRDYITLICPFENLLYTYKLSKVYAEEAVGISVNKEGEEVRNNTLVVIPFKCICSETYKEPKEWEKLSQANKQKYYTIREGDTIMVNTTPSGVSSLEEIKNKYDRVYDVQAIKRFDKVFPHWEVTCK